MSTAVVVFTRALRLHDHPALAAGVDEADRVVPLFVVDPTIVRGPFGAPNRLAYLHESLADLRDGLRALGADLVLRAGDPTAETIKVARAAGAEVVHVTGDVTGFAARREAALARGAADARIELRRHPGLSVVEPGLLRPAGGDHYRVFSPFHRAWSRAALRPLAARPRSLGLPAGVDLGPSLDRVLPASRRRGTSPLRLQGGESRARRQLDDWLSAGGLSGYEAAHDDLAGDRTSRLSAHLHFGCLSARELVASVQRTPGAAPFLRQLCWRDFFHQVTAALPAIGVRDYRPRGRRWVDDDDAVQAWAEGRTGHPIVDAGMRQLLREGWMHNRARLVTASFLVKDLGIDWRVGAAHFLHWLTDGDIAQNSANWQWVAGTGNDTRPNRVLNPLRQGERFDPDGSYVARHVPELADAVAQGVRIHRLGRAGAGPRPAGYPAPLVDHDAAAAAFRAHRTGQLQLPL